MITEITADNGTSFNLDSLSIEQPFYNACFPNTTFTGIRANGSEVTETVSVGQTRTVYLTKMIDVQSLLLKSCMADPIASHGDAASESHPVVRYRKHLIRRDLGKG